MREHTRGAAARTRRRSRRVVEVARQQRLRLRKRRRAEDLLSVGVVGRAVGGDAADDSVAARDQRLLVGRQLGGGVDEGRPLRRQLEDAVPRERQVVVGAVEKVAQPRRREGAARVRRVGDVPVSGLGRRSSVPGRPLEGWWVASKGLGTLPRRRVSALAHGCGRSGRAVLRLPRAAVISTG